MTRERKPTAIMKIHAAMRSLIASGMRRPLWRVYKREKPRCGARCRDGHPCRAPAAYDAAKCRPKNGRCRVHGGLSTGPGAVEGGERRVKEVLEQWTT